MRISQPFRQIILRKFAVVMSQKPQCEVLGRH